MYIHIIWITLPSVARDLMVPQRLFHQLPPIPWLRVQNMEGFDMFHSLAQQCTAPQQELDKVGIDSEGPEKVRIACSLVRYQI